MRASTVLTLDRMDFDAIFQQINLMSNMSFRNFNSRSDGLRYDFSTNKLKYSSYLSTSEPRGKDSAPRTLRVFIRPPSEVSAILCEPCS